MTASSISSVKPSPAERHGLMVYLWRADSVKARLQQYGCSGTYMDIGNSLTSARKDAVNVVAEGPGLFREVFSRGYSMVFQCARLLLVESNALNHNQIRRLRRGVTAAYEGIPLPEDAFNYGD